MDDDFPQPAPRMSFLTAASWSMVALVALFFLTSIVGGLHPDAGLDLVTDVLCQAAAFLSTLYVLVRIHESERPLSDVFALRPAPVSLTVFGAIAGAALQLPCTGLEQLIERRWPRSESDLSAMAQAFAAPTPGHKVALLVAAALVGPLVEELFFRGAIFRGLRRGHDAVASVVGTALLFAAAHVDARFFAPVLAVGLVVTYARATSGSLFPGLALHAAFNATAVVATFTAASTAPGASDAPVPIAWSVGGTALALIALSLFTLAARRSGVCTAARAADRA